MTTLRRVAIGAGLLGLVALAVGASAEALQPAAFVGALGILVAIGILSQPLPPEPPG